MDPSQNKLTLLAFGSSSQIFSYGDASSKVVLKVVSVKDPKAVRHLRNEFHLLKGEQHPHIIRALRYQENVAFEGTKLAKQFTTKNVLVLQHATQGSLLHFLTKHTPTTSQKKKVFKQVINAVQHLHAQKIAHRDLKLENVLITMEEQELLVKVSDFGFAARCQKDGQQVRFNEYKGTRKGYMAPEIHACHTDSENWYHAMPTDIFALGVMLFAIFMGKLPFQTAQKENKLYAMIALKKYEQFWAFHHQLNHIFQEEPNNMRNFKELFQKMVSLDPNQRPTAEQVIKDGWMG